MSWYNNNFDKPKMTEDEFNYLIEDFSTDDVVLEYGSGNSTPNLAPLCKTLWTVEHHPMWYNKVKEMCVDFENINHVLVELEGDRYEGKPDNWNSHPDAYYGWPVKFSVARKYATWSMDKDLKFDKMFIDGRARQWVAQSLLNNLKPSSILYVHDYDRERYYSIERFYDKIGQVGTMAKFRSKI